MRYLAPGLVCMSLALLPAAVALAAEANNSAPELKLPRVEIPGLLYTPIGVTRQGTPIPAYITADDLDLHTKKHRVLLVAGLDGSRPVVDSLVKVLNRFYHDDEFRSLRDRIALSAVLCGNPDGYRHGLNLANGAGGEPAGAFPPPADAYASRTVPEAQYLWRWIAMHTPECVVEMVEGTTTETATPAARSLIDALSQTPRATTRAAITLTVKAGDERPFLRFVADLKDGVAKQPEPSDRWLELGRLAERSPQEVAQQLAQVYGHALPKVQYISALALVGRLRLGAATGDSSQRADVERIVAPYLTGQHPALGPKSSGSEFAGHLIFSELVDPTRKSEAQNLACIGLIRAVADLGFDAAGKPREALPGHSEMSDAVFMGCPILAAAGHLTGKPRYYQMCLRHLRFMRRLTLRTDGLYRHSPLCEAAWGRGNGFPALGLAWTLSEWPTNEPGRNELLGALRNHLEALLPYQDPTGCWHQVIDHPESYREFSCTCMIAWAMARGVRLGLLSRQRFDPAIQRAWQAIKLRTQPDGTLVDVCVGTGKQPTLRDYFDRPATWGRDDRGGAMALLLATEMLEYQRPDK